MTRDTAPAPESGSAEVMASIDSGGCTPRLVIADITADESWISVAASASASLVEWR